MQRVLLIIGGGIAAYKAPELVRQLRAQGLGVRCLMTAAAAQFVSPLSLASVSGDTVYENLFDLTDETEMGHIQLSRDADIILVAPATADLMAKAAQGMANDLASTTLLATDKKIIMAPAMNVRMWQHEATQRNLAQLQKDGVRFIGPEEGDMACGEFGPGRMSEPQSIALATAQALGAPNDTSDMGATGTMEGLAGRKILVTAGPTHEPIDPVRYIANRSSGKQGYAIASALAAAGAEVHLVSGPTALPAPQGVNIVPVETARDMLAATQALLPVDAAVMTAAVADWRPVDCDAQKIKKNGDAPPVLDLVENPDILATLGAAGKNRPALLIGFAAETENLETHARAKLAKKNCDWIIANNVGAESGIDGGVMGGDENAVSLLCATGAKSAPTIEHFDIMSKQAVAEFLTARIGAHFAASKNQKKGKVK